MSSKFSWIAVILLTVALGSPSLGVTSVEPVAAKSKQAQKHRKPGPQHQTKHGKHRKQITVKIHRGGRGGTPGDDYPAQWKNRAQDSVLDNWKMLNRECTSFAAWALSSRNGFNIPFHANAIDWGPMAQARGYRVDTNPAPGSIAWSNRGRFGHVAWVSEAGGGNVTVEEYNQRNDGRYGTRTVSTSTFTGYIHFKDLRTAQPFTPDPQPIQGGSSQPIQGGSNNTGGGIQGSSPNVQNNQPPSNGGESTPPPEKAPAAPPTWQEQEGHYGVNTFTNPYNASGMGPKIQPWQWVEVSCRIYAPQIQSANPDGWWYRIHSSPWNDAYYSPANTFMNGDAPGESNHNTDFAVREC